MMEYCGLDPFPSTSTTSAPPNESDSGYEPSPSSTSGPNSMFNFEEEESCSSEPDDMFNLNSLSEDDSDDDFRSRITGHSTSSPIPIPFPGRQMLLSNSTPRLGYSINVNHSPFRRLSCPQILNTGLVRVMRHASTQTCHNEDLDTVDDEPRLTPVRAPLPDVVQHNGSRSGHVERPRSSSVSLPVGSLGPTHLAEIGQTLRRLSDEFERSRRSTLSLLFQSRSRRSRSYSQSDT